MFDDADSLIGREVGPYRVVRELGRGGMGVVYAAEDRRLGRTVALKALIQDYTADPVFRARLSREARMSAALSHPAIATIYALEEIDGLLYIVSEFVRGRTLREELRDGPLPRQRLIATLIDIAEALAAAHDQGVVHRDLKPSNVIRGHDGRSKILDFGIAVMAPAYGPSFTRLTQTGVALGTPGYMAPEQLKGGVVDGRTDIFAFGVLIWELATGEHPFGAGPADLIARMTELMDGRVSALSRPLPVADLDRIARRCLRAAPEERYQSARELIEHLRPLASPPPSAPNHGDTADASLWWWQFHQAAMAVIHGSTPVAAWLIRGTVDAPWGQRIFFATLVMATISVTLRLHLVFVSRIHRKSLKQQRARAFPAVVAVELLLVLLLASAAGLVATTTKAALAIPMVITAIVSLAALTLIEPATTRAAGLAAPPSQGNKTTDDSGRD